MELGNGETGDGRPAEQPDYLFLAWHLEQKLTDFIASGNPPELELRSVLDLSASHVDRIAAAEDGQRDYAVVALLLRDMLTDLVDLRRLPLQGVLHEAATRRFISCDAKVMNPGLWRNLPPELLELVFARLPLQRINRLQLLSTKCRNELKTPHSLLNGAIIDAHPNLVTLVSETELPSTEYRVRTFDSSKNTWDPSLSYHFFKDPNADPWITCVVNEGFFLCRSSGVSRRVIVVMNLLMRVRHELRPFDLDVENCQFRN